MTTYSHIEAAAGLRAWLDTAPVERGPWTDLVLAAISKLEHTGPSASPPDVPVHLVHEEES